MRYEQGFIAVTSDKWFDFIFSHDLKRVNFWCKKKAFKAILPGQPLFFLRKNSKGEKGERKVVGFGILDDFELCSCQQAWDFYGLGNGFSSYHDFYEGVKEILDKATDENLGCIVLKDVTFFSKPVLLSDLGIGFSSAIVSGKRINSDEVDSILIAGGDNQSSRNQLDQEIEVEELYSKGMDISKQILKAVLEVVELKGSIRFMDIVRYVWEQGIDCRPQDVSKKLHNHCAYDKRLSSEPYFYKVETGLYRMANDAERLEATLWLKNKKKHFNDSSQEVDAKFIEGETVDKKRIISEFTKDLLHEKGFLLDHSNNTRIRFSTERLDSIVGFMGEGWSKQIKRLLLFEIENREDNYTLKLIIGPGNQEIRDELYTKAKENPDLYNIRRNHLSEQFTTIYSKKILTDEQLSSYSPEQLKKHIAESLEDFIKCDLNPLCEGLRSQQQIDLENQLLDIITDDNFDNLEETEKSTCMKARIGHSKLKEILVKKDGCCKICGLSDERFLIASHIKPWSKSNNQQRLDLNNVLLLCPHHDAAFDKGYITFDQEGFIIISSELTLETRALLNLNPNQKIEFTTKQSEYLLWHRENVFHT